MKTFGVCCFAALLVGIVLNSHGVTDDNLTFFSPEDTQSSDPFGNKTDEPATVEFVEEIEIVEVAPREVGLEALRRQYLEAAKERAGLMDAEALRQAIEAEQSTVAELQAQRALKQVEQQLEQISERYADTLGGRRARNLLSQLRARERNNNQGFIFEDPSGFSEDLSEPERRINSDLEPTF